MRFREVELSLDRDTVKDLLFSNNFIAVNGEIDPLLDDLFRYIEQANCCLGINNNYKALDACLLRYRYKSAGLTNVLCLKNGRATSSLDTSGSLQVKNKKFMALQLICIRNYVVDKENQRLILLSAFLNRTLINMPPLRIDMSLSQFVLESYLALELARLNILEVVGNNVRYTHDRNKNIRLDYDLIFDGSGLDYVMQELNTLKKAK